MFIYVNIKANSKRCFNEAGTYAFMSNINGGNKKLALSGFEALFSSLCSINTIFVFIVTSIVPRRGATKTRRLIYIDEWEKLQDPKKPLRGLTSRTPD